MKFYTNVLLWGDSIMYRGYEHGQPVQFRDRIRPKLFMVPDEQSKRSKFRTLDGRYAHPQEFDGARSARQFIEEYENVDGMEVHGYERFVYQWISDNYPDEIRFDMSQMNIFTIDIEVACENGFPDVQASAEEMLCITMKDVNSKKTITWGTREYSPKDTEYRVFWTEQEMLKDFIDWWAQNTPDVITGWNCNLYDIPYICRRVDRVLGEKWVKALSPWKKVDMREIKIRGRDNLAYEIAGVTILDYLDLYQKFTYTNQESYRLDHIAYVELGQNKLDHSQFENFKDFYTSDWQRFVEYNIQDVNLVDRLEDKMKLIELGLTLAYDAKVNLSDVYSQVRMWDTLIYNDLKKRGVVVPPRTSTKKDDKYAGAYVKEPKPGVYDWVVSFDLNSLYPHLIMQYNISPETLVEERFPGVTVDKLLNREVEPGSYCLCANGAQYRKDIHGFLPEIMQRIYDERTIYKKHMLKAKQEYEQNPTEQLQKDIARFNNIQMARKIQLNSAYGAIGNQYFRYYNLANAEAITLSGQVSIRWIENKMNTYLNKVLKTEEIDYVIASDTDSIYLNMGPMVQAVFKEREESDIRTLRFLTKVCDVELEKYIQNSYEELATYVNAYDNKMVMKRENIANKGIWTAKKRYILNVWDSEGVRYEKPKLKMMGIEAVKSSTPGPCRNKIKQALEIMMSGTEQELQDFVSDFRTDFESMPLEDIAFPRGCNNIAKNSSPHSIYGKSCPIHVRGALLYNHYIKKHKISHKYPLIQEGEKIKFLYLKKPNRINENVISFFQTLPTEFGLDKQVDYELQFSKSFLEPLKVILDTMNWHSEPQATLEFLFGD